MLGAGGGILMDLFLLNRFREILLFRNNLCGSKWMSRFDDTSNNTPSACVFGRISIHFVISQERLFRGDGLMAGHPERQAKNLLVDWLWNKIAHCWRRPSGNVRYKVARDRISVNPSNKTVSGFKQCKERKRRFVNDKSYGGIRGNFNMYRRNIASMPDPRPFMPRVKYNPV